MCVWVRLTWAIALVLAAYAAPARAMAPIVPPTPEEMREPAGVREYREAVSVAIVRPVARFNPPCWLVRLSHWLAAGRRMQDYCDARERSRRYDFVVEEVLKGDPPSQFPALLNFEWPLDPDFMKARRPDLWGEVFRFDRKRAQERHAGFAFLHVGIIRDLDVETAAPFDIVPMDSNGPERPVIDPTLDYVVFLGTVADIPDVGIRHWEPILRGGADRDLLVQRLRRLRAGVVDVRLTVAPSELFPRFLEAAIYEAGDCKPRMLGGFKISGLDRNVLDWFGSPNAGRTHCYPGDPSPRAERYLALMPDRTDPYIAAFDERGPQLRVLPIIDGKVRPSDLITQLRVQPETPIPVEQALAWVRTGRRAQAGSDEGWSDIHYLDPPLKLSGR